VRTEWLEGGDGKRAIERGRRNGSGRKGKVGREWLKGDAARREWLEGEVEREWLEKEVVKEWSEEEVGRGRGKGGGHQ
jgi:hypothetical protein